MDEISHLIKAAKAGRSPSASGGEQRAYRLARLLLQAIEECPGTDFSIIDGACQILRFANYGGEGYQTVKEQLDAATLQSNPETWDKQM